MEVDVHEWVKVRHGDLGMFRWAQRPFSSDQLCANDVLHFTGVFVILFSGGVLVM